MHSSRFLNNKFALFSITGSLAILSSLMPTAQAVAQDDTVTIEEALQICNRIKNTRDRLDCFEGLADAAAPEPETSARNAKDDDELAITVAPQPDQPVQAPGTPEQPVAPTVATPNIAPPVDSEGQSASRKRFVILPEEEAKERLDVKRTPREKGENYTSPVRKAWFNSERKLMVLLANGEIWKQNQSESVRLPKSGTEASLKKTRLGSWFVKLPPNYRSVRMRIINP